MTDDRRPDIMQNSRLLILGLVAVSIIFGLALVVLAIGGGACAAGQRTGQRPGQQQ